MGIRVSLFAIVSALALSGCATPDMTNWTPEQIAAYRASEQQAYNEIIARGQSDLAAMNQRTQTMIQNPMVIPQAGPYGQPNSTSTFYCRDLTGSIVTCKQVR